MAKIVKPLTATQVKEAAIKETEYNLSDGDGLALRIMPNGTKKWIFNYSKPYTKKRTNISIGKYPDVSLLNARKARAKFREQLADNIDPKTQRDDEVREKLNQLNNTFQKVVDSWYELKKQNVKPVTYEKAWGILTKHALPQLGSYPITEIKPHLVVKVLKPLEAKGSIETLKRLCRTINEIMRHALAGGLIEFNPLTDVTKLFPPVKHQNMLTIAPERLPEFMKALASASITRTTRCLVEWQLYTMTRPVEAASAEWQEIDLDKMLWTIPADKMKKGKSHSVPLTPQMIAILEVMKPISGHLQYVFPSHRDNRKHANRQSANMAIKRMGFHGELVSHGLRALASTTLNENGIDPELVEACLAHVDKDKVRGAYNRAEYIEQRREIMEWWNDHIKKASLAYCSIADI